MNDRQAVLDMTHRNEAYLNSQRIPVFLYLTPTLDKAVIDCGEAGLGRGAQHILTNRSTTPCQLVNRRPALRIVFQERSVSVALLVLQYA